VPITPPHVVAPETLPRWPYQLAERYGDAEALVEPAGEVRTFGELGRRVTAGDLGHLDEDGGFTYVARKDDALRLAGFLVTPPKSSDSWSATRA
jgi:acyl-coenzyme A synthetase/AMP-(fatty) acid ligase